MVESRKSTFVFWDYYTDPSQSGAVLPINERIREECFNENLFPSLRHVCGIIAGRHQYKDHYLLYWNLDGLAPQRITDEQEGTKI